MLRMFNHLDLKTFVRGGGWSCPQTSLEESILCDLIVIGVGYLTLFEYFSQNHYIAGFHSRYQQPCFSTKTKGSVCIIIELNSRRIWSGHQHGHLSLFRGTNMAVENNINNDS